MYLLTRAAFLLLSIILTHLMGGASASAENRVAVLIEGQVFPSTVAPAVAKGLAARGLTAMADGEVRAALAFGDYPKQSPRDAEELERLREETGSTYIFEVQSKAGDGGEIAVRVVARSSTAERIGFASVASSTSSTEVPILVLKVLDSFPALDVAAPRVTPPVPEGTAPVAAPAAPAAVPEAGVGSTPPATAGSGELSATVAGNPAKENTSKPSGFHIRAHLGLGNLRMSANGEEGFGLRCKLQRSTRNWLWGFRYRSVPENRHFPFAHVFT